MNKTIANIITSFIPFKNTRKKMAQSFNVWTYSHNPHGKTPEEITR